MKLVEENGKRRWVMDEMPILREGERPGRTVLTAEGKIEKRKLPPMIRWKNKTIGNMTICDKDELWGHDIICNKCGTLFQAFTKDIDGYSTVNIFNFCPGCGCELVDRSDEKTVEQIKKILEE